MTTVWWISSFKVFSIKTKISLFVFNSLLWLIIYKTYRWQVWSVPLKHIKAFSSGTLKVLQDPNAKSNNRSDCLNISHPTILLALKIVHLFLKWLLWNLPVVYDLPIRQNTKIDLVMSLHIRLEQTLHFHSWNRHLPWHLLIMRSFIGF